MSILAGSLIVIASWAIENNLVYFCGNSGWVYDYDSFLGYWGNNLVYFWDYSGWVYDSDSFLVISNGGFVILIVSWAIEK